MVRLVAPTVCLMIALSGCAGSSGLDETGRTVLAEDQYYQFQFKANRQVTLELAVEVHDGPNIDVFVMDELNFQQFEAGNSFVHYESCGGVAAQGFVRSCTLNEGTYSIVLDNTNAGNAAPPFNGVDDGADVSWTIKGL